MHLIPIVLILWGAVITSMIALLVFNAACCNCKENGSHADCSEVEKKRREKVFLRAQRLHPYIRASGSLSALMTLGLAGVAGWAAIESLIR